MDKINAWLSDRKNMPVVIGAGGIVVVLLIIVFLLRARSNASQAVAPAPSTQTAASTATANVSMPGQPNNAAAGPMGPGMAMQGVQTPAGAGVATVASAIPDAPVQSPMLPYRKDPFTPMSGAPTRAKVLNSMVPSMITVPRLAVLRQPVKPAIVDVAVQETEVLPPQPYRRMAGVLINGKISAILETNGESDIVIPGMEISRGGSKVRVESVSSDEIVLRTLDTKKPMFVKVNLTGSTASQGSGAGSAIR